MTSADPTIVSDSVKVVKKLIRILDLVCAGVKTGKDELLQLNLS